MLAINRLCGFKICAGLLRARRRLAVPQLFSLGHARWYIKPRQQGNAAGFCADFECRCIGYRQTPRQSGSDQPHFFCIRNAA